MNDFTHKTPLNFKEDNLWGFFILGCLSPLPPAHPSVILPFIPSLYTSVRTSVRPLTLHSIPPPVHSCLRLSRAITSRRFTEAEFVGSETGAVMPKKRGLSSIMCLFTLPIKRVVLVLRSVHLLPFSYGRVGIVFLRKRLPT